MPSGSPPCSCLRVDGLDALPGGPVATDRDLVKRPPADAASTHPNTERAPDEAQVLSKPSEAKEPAAELFPTKQDEETGPAGKGPRLGGGTSVRVPGVRALPESLARISHHMY